MSWGYLYTFLQSNFLEVPFYLWGIAKTPKLLNSKLKGAVLVTLANSITHPIVFFGIMAAGLSRLNAILLAETWAIVGETVILSLTLQNKMATRRILWIAILANWISWELGPRLSYLIFIGKPFLFRT